MIMEPLNHQVLDKIYTYIYIYLSIYLSPLSISCRYLTMIRILSPHTGQTIPILLQSLDMKIYPEGGYIVAGLPNRIYVEAFTPTGEPADFTGAIVHKDHPSVVLGNISTQHEGRGNGTFTPSIGSHGSSSYEVRVLTPASVRIPNVLPRVMEHGVVLSSVKNVYGPSDAIVMELGSTRPGNYRVGVYKKDLELAVVYADINKYVYIQLLDDLMEHCLVIRC